MSKTTHHLASSPEHTEAVKAIADFLPHRPQASELVQQQILKDPSVAPALQPAKADLEERILHRPHRSELVEHNILKNTTVSPALQAKETELARSKLEDALESKIKSRPPHEELVNRHIIQD